MPLALRLRIVERLSQSELLETALNRWTTWNTGGRKVATRRGYSFGLIVFDLAVVSTVNQSRLRNSKFRVIGHYPSPRARSISSRRVLLLPRNRAAT